VNMSSGASGRIRALAEYPSQSSYYNYSISCSSASDDSIQGLMHGLLYSLPDNNQSEVQSYTLQYPKSRVYNNLIGGVKFDGLSTPGYKRQVTAKWNEVSSTQRDTMVTIFTLGKGGLPVLFVNDVTDANSFYVVGMKSLTVTEPYVEAFNVSLLMEEF